MRFSCACFVLTASILTIGSPARGAITLYAEYHLGEAGSLGANNLPLDSSGNLLNFTNEISGAAASVITSGVFAPGSTAYLSTAGGGNEGWYAPNLFTGLATDNFALGVFARASSLADQGDIFTVGTSPAGFKLSLAGNGWAASCDNVAWIGGDSGVSGSFTPDTWVHLALIRSGGSTSFYINGVAQGSAFGGAPTNSTPHASVSPGGGTFFDGGLDEARVVTFSAGESTANVLGALQGVPEPGAVLSLAAGFGMLLASHRRRRV